MRISWHLSSDARPTAWFQALIVALAVGATACASDPAETADPRVLVFSKTAGYRHASIEPGIEALRRLAAEHGLELDATEDAAEFTPDHLAGYRAVIFLSTTGDVLDEVQQEALTGFVRAGGGFVGIHAASDTEYDWPWYGRLVGGYFNGHPGGPNVREGTLMVAEPRHAAAVGLPNPWTRTDEWYDIRNQAPDVTVLLNVDETTYKTPSENPAPAPRPIAWLHEFDGGRSFYTALGHTSESFTEPAFLDHVWGGLRYVLGIDTDP